MSEYGFNVLETETTRTTRDTVLAGLLTRGASVQALAWAMAATEGRNEIDPAECRRLLDAAEAEDPSWPSWLRIYWPELHGLAFVPEAGPRRAPGGTIG